MICTLERLNDIEIVAQNIFAAVEIIAGIWAIASLIVCLPLILLTLPCEQEDDTSDDEEE